jgi:hypothetical protein
MKTITRRNGDTTIIDGGHRYRSHNGVVTPSNKSAQRRTDVLKRISAFLNGTVVKQHMPPTPGSLRSAIRTEHRDWTRTQIGAEVLRRVAQAAKERELAANPVEPTPGV